MKTAMGNGTSALLSFQKAMAVESHNAGNTKSVAYKADTVSFAEMFYSQSVGLGVSMNTPIKDFSQGGLVPTNSEYDFAIEGEGFFQLQDPLNPEQLLYTRAGQFKSDKENYLSDMNGMRVLGVVPEVSGDIIKAIHTNNIASSVIETDSYVESLNVYSTDYKMTAYEKGPTGISGNNFKSIDSNLNDIEETIYEYKQALKAYDISPVEGETASKAESNVIFPTTLSNDGSYTLEIIVNGVKIQQSYETSIENTLNQFSNKINELAGITSSVDITTGTVSINSMISGNNLNLRDAKLNGDKFAINEVSKASGSGKALLDAIYNDLQSVMQNVDAEVVQNNSRIDYIASGETLQTEQLILDLHALNMNSTLYEKLLNADPEQVASYPGIESENGYLYLSDGDARFLIGKLAPVHFSDKTILNPEGDSLYSLSDAEIQPTYLAEGVRVVGKYLEYSNVDISEQLVNLLSYQKAFEANSKSISTADEMMKTALALKNR